ncbi:hypothetical protein [Pelagicoccus sp. SDUM812005]|uniref:hypothetical protein n=1 Tax=Pelagicoccus sp. SDUM812005 TaxID=3041257 RepID=UPI002811CA62|nr:hypothetical protein [Pelagicoccus sp. SDUM812005]
MIGFLFSALLGIALVVVIALLARREMVKHTKANEKDREREKAGEAESRGADDGPNVG